MYLHCSFLFPNIYHLTLHIIKAVLMAFNLYTSSNTGCGHILAFYGTEVCTYSQLFCTCIFCFHIDPCSHMKQLRLYIEMSALESSLLAPADLLPFCILHYLLRMVDCLDDWRCQGTEALLLGKKFCRCGTWQHYWKEGNLRACRRPKVQTLSPRPMCSYSSYTHVP